MSLEAFFVRLANRYLRPTPRKPRGRDLVLGKTTIHEREERVIWRERTRHLVVMGKTGTGKSYFLRNLVTQDIEHGTGFCLVDWHGDLSANLITYLASHTEGNEELRNRIVIVEPWDETHTIGFNPLERSSHTSPFLQAQELAQILRLRWKQHDLGPRSEELLRAALYTISARGLTLLELPQLLTDAAFRRRLVGEIGEKAIADYWQSRYDTKSAAMQAQVREPLLSRLSSFLSVPQIREIVGQRKSTFSFDEAVRKSLWVIVNLSKGMLGEENAEVLGSLFLAKLQFAVLAQARFPEVDRKLFALYADELQNLVSGESFGTLIAEARKYRLSVVAGHQYWGQLSPEMRAAMLGAGSRMLFRVSYHDARELAGELDARGKETMAVKLTKLKEGEAIFQSGADRAVTVRVEKHKEVICRPEEVERLKAHARTRYAMRRAAIQKDIWRRFAEGSKLRIEDAREESETGQVL